MQQIYTLEWLDLVVSVTLNPAKTDPGALDSSQAEMIIAKVHEESSHLRAVLKQRTFTLFSRKKIELLIKQYHSNLVVLLDIVYENTHQIGQEYVLTRRICQSVIDCIEGLLNFLEKSFGEYIGLDERVPAAYLAQIKRDLRGRTDLVKIKLISGVGNKNLTDILLHALYSFTNEPQKRVVTYREVFYKKELVKELEKIGSLSEEVKMHDVLVEQMICLNFNSRAFMNYYTQKIAQKANSYGPLNEKMDHLLFHYKEFKQMHHQSDVRLNPHYSDVKKAVGNWFVQEISYLEKKHQWDVSPLPQVQQSSKMDRPEPFKVLCFLSVDQIALIFRAMDSLRILQSRSLNLVFQSIAPYLSTPRKEEISWKSMRSKSSGFEQSDREVVITTLQNIISWVREY
jgi:hypothetical protein